VTVPVFIGVVRAQKSILFFLTPLNWKTPYRS